MLKKISLKNSSYLSSLFFLKFYEKSVSEFFLREKNLLKNLFIMDFNQIRVMMGGNDVCCFKLYRSYHISLINKIRRC